MTTFVVVIIFVVLGGFVLSIFAGLLNSITKNLNVIFGASNRCKFCKKKLPFASGSFASVCPRCGRQQPPPVPRFVPKSRKLSPTGTSGTLPFTFTDCRYEGGFGKVNGPIDPVTVVISAERFEMQLPAAVIRLYRFEYPWNQVRGFEVSIAPKGFRFSIINPQGQKGAIVFRGAEPLAFWRCLDQVDALRSRIPANIRDQLNTPPEVLAQREVERREAVRSRLFPSAPGSRSVADELEKLANLKSKGLLSEAEFARQKAKLLDQ